MESFRHHLVHKLQLKLQGNKMVTKPVFHKHMQGTSFPTCACRVVQVFYVLPVWCRYFMCFPCGAGVLWCMCFPCGAGVLCASRVVQVFMYFPCGAGVYVLPVWCRCLCASRVVQVYVYH